MKIMKTTWIGIGAAILLSACATNQGYIHTNSGASVQAAIEPQIVDKKAATGAPEMHPDKIAAAVERYLEDEVKRPNSRAEVEFGSGQDSE